MRRSIRVLAASVVLLLAAPPAAAQRIVKEPAAPAAPAPMADTSHFVVVVGTDTVAREWFVRRGRVLTGTLRLFRPREATVAYRGFERADATLDSMLYTAEANGLRSSTAIRFPGDSMEVEAADGQATARVERMAVPAGTIPYVNLSTGVLEQIVRRAQRARRTGGGTVEVPLAAGARPLTAPVTFIGADSATLTLGGTVLRIGVDAEGRVSGGHVPSQGARFVRVAAPAAGTPAGPPPRDYGAPVGAPYTAEEVIVRTPAGLRLAGTLTLPVGASARRRAPVVVTISGSGPQDRDSELVGIPGYRIFRQVADSLGRRGIGVLRLDDRGVGGSAGGSAEATSADFADDVRAALAWLRARGDVDGRRLGLLGHSEGAMIAPMVAAGDTLLRAVALLAGTVRPGWEISALQRRAAIDGLPGLSAAARDSLQRAGDAGAAAAEPTLPAWVRFFWRHDPRPAASRVRAPVLVVHGETDRQVPVAHGEALAEAIRGGGNRDVTVRRFPRLNHLFLEDPTGDPQGYAALPSTTVPAVVIGTLADWFADRLRR